MTLMVRLYLLVLLAVAPAISLLFYNDWNEQRQREIDAKAQVLRYARLLSGEMDLIFEAIRAELNTVAEAPSVQSFNDPECGQYLERLEAINPATTTVSVYDLTGNRRCSNVALTGIADRPYFLRALQSDTFVVGEYTIGQISRLPVLPFAQRVERDRQVTGVLVTTLRLDWLQQYLASKSGEFPPGTSITVVDRAGTILVHLPNPEQERAKFTHFPQLLAPEPGGATFQLLPQYSADGVARLVGYTSIEAPPRGIVVVVGIPMDAVVAGIEEARLRNLLLLGLSTLMAFGAAHFGGRAFVLRPVSDLLTAAERLRKGDLAARVDVTSPRTELGQLSAAFNMMAADLENSLRYKDVLLRELSHRMMNSLQTIASLFTMQARVVRDPDARRQFDQVVTRINSVALAYRRLHMEDGVEVIDFAELLQELCSDLQASMMPESRPIAVEADLILLSPEQAVSLALVVNELVTNAVKHGGPEASIKVKLSRSSDGCRLAVRNRGELPPSYNPAATQGFGMRMVRATVAQLNGRLDAASMQGETEFAVSFQPTVAQPTNLGVVEGGRQFADAS